MLDNIITEETEKPRHNNTLGSLPGDISFDLRKQKFAGKTFQGRTPVNFFPNATITKETTISPMNERSDGQRGDSA